MWSGRFFLKEPALAHIQAIRIYDALLGLFDDFIASAHLWMCSILYPVPETSDHVLVVFSILS